MDDRRIAARYPAAEDRIWLGRWVRSGEFQVDAARVENISEGGAKLVAESPPAEFQRVWLRLGNPSCLDCVEASVLEVRGLDRGGFAIRLAFDAPCPPRVLGEVANGSIPRPHFRRSPRGESRKEAAVSANRERSER